MIEKFQGAINDSNIEQFSNWVHMGDLSLFEYSIWKNGLDGIIATSYFLSPSFIQIDEYVFAYDLICNNDLKNEDFIEELKERFKSKKAIEQYVNCVCVGDLFINNQQYLRESELIDMFVDCVTYFWGNRLKQTFPEKKFVFERGNNINGDLGPCFTFYEI